MNRSERRAAKRRSENIGEGLAALAIIAAIANAASPTPGAAVSGTAKDRGRWLAATLLQHADDDDAQDNAFEVTASNATSTEDMATVLAYALKFVMSGYVPVLLNRTDELEVDEYGIPVADTTRAALIELAREDAASEPALGIPTSHEPPSATTGEPRNTR